MQAIVLSRRPWRDHDEVITLFTDELGKIEALARGSKKIISKNSPSLEPPSLCQVSLIPAKENWLLTTAEAVTSFSNIRQNLEKALVAARSCAVIEKILPPAEPDSELFNNFKDWLIFLESATLGLTSLYPAFILKLVGHSGFRPNLYACAECAEDKLPKLNLYFSVSSGGLLCEACATGSVLSGQPPQPIFKISTDVVKALRLYLVGSWDVISRLKLSEENLKQITAVIKNFFEFHFAQKINIFI
ncbi:MAG: DNA repair protein RecO [Candidatus Magasanikbacteria bacterium]|nr:DNA repair protein RecO [Candidatus Magasanikbacteria bacterium]